MKLCSLRRVLPSAAFIVLAAALASAGPAGAEGPAVGDRAPDFELAGSDGERHSLAQHRGQRAVVLAWFPKAFTGG